MTIPESTTAGVPSDLPEVGRAPREHAFRRILRDPVAIVTLGFITIVAALSFAAPLLTSSSPTAPSLADTLGDPAPGHPLGFDGVGRDVFARLVYGGQTSLTGALIAVAVALAIGLPAGLVAGYFKGWFDATSSWLANLTMAMPAIIVLLVVMAAVGQNTFAAMAVFGVLLSPGVFRLVRASVVSVREELYVDAARVAGLGDARIIRRHILPVVQAPTIIQVAQMFGIGIIIQAGLEFLGLGSASKPSWGAMLNDAFQNIYREPSLLLWPGLAVALTVAAFALLGNSLRDALGTGIPAPAVKKRPDKGSAAAASTAEAGPAEGDAANRLLTLRNLRVSYASGGGESVVVDGVSIDVNKGEVLGLVGESGSGKTQTAFAVLGLLPPEASVDADDMTFGGQHLGRLSSAAMNDLRGRKIAYIPQEPMSNLDPSFRIGEQITEPMRQQLGLSKSAAKQRALALLARVGIPDPQRTYNAYPHEVSGGMAQRVLIAGAVSCDPELLIADEPTTALDVTVQAEVLDLMRDLQAERGMGMILVTHDFGVVADICDRIAVMQKGKVVEMAPAGRLFADPQHPYTRMLLDSTLEDSEPRAPLSGSAATKEVRS
jgi:peptide/nickel transport system permease protein